MTPQHRASPQISTHQGEEASTHEKKKMKTMLQRRRTAQSVISRALSKPRTQTRAGISVERCPWHVNQPDVAFTHGSFFVMEDHVYLTNGLQTQERHLFLFTDVLIIAKSKSSASLKVKAQVRLSEMWLASCVEQVTERKLSSKNSFVIGWPTTNYVVTLSSTETKEKWLSTLKWYIVKSKQDELPSKIAMGLLVLLDDRVFTAALQLDSSATADDIIQTVALQYELRGPPAEYQLWVESAAEEAPCVLIGHECPYSIILHHLRVSECLPMVRSSLLTAEGTLHLELLPREVPVPLFTFRARSVRHHPTQTDFSQKQRRKRSLIDWALRRGTSNQSSCPPDSPCSALFGQPLSTICPHGSPPQPIMDMLYTLYQEGPSTQGIFRRSANAKSCRELKEKLNGGMEYLPEGESVLVIAAVFTDFLRSLPGSVLGSHLCERWMEVTDVEEEEEWRAVIASLVAELPEENSTLLRYMFWVLHRIHQHSEDNQMTASNLALCIAPSMLTLPSPSSAEEETKAMKKVAELIQLLIENTPSIFGEDVGGLLLQWRNMRDEQGVCEETGLPAKQMGQKAASSVSLLSPPDHFLLPLAALALREDVGFATPSVSSVSVCSIPAGLGHLRSSRCASEPTVCPAQPPAHVPVARQSSCDAAVMGGSSGQSQSPSTQARHFQAKQKQAWRGDGSPRTGKGRYSLWRSPQIAPRLHHTAGHQPSLSSLSSTATSSVSSLDSALDSALSLTSSETLSSPNDTASRPFLFGATARLRPLTPDVPRKFPPDWSMAFPHEEVDGEGEEEEGEEEEEEEEVDEEAKRRSERGTWAGVTDEEQVEAAEGEGERSSSRWRGRPDVTMTVCPASVGDGEQVLWTSESWGEQSVTGPHRGQGKARETSVTHIKLSSSSVQLPTRSNLPEVEKVQRTKITFYASSATLTVKEPAARLATDPREDSPIPAGTASPQNHTVRVHIPQTVFYGQNAPLVLRSVSTRAPAAPDITDGVDSPAHTGCPRTRITVSGGISLSNNAWHGAPTANGAEGTVAVQVTGASQDVIASGGGRGSPGPTVPPSSPKPHSRASAAIRHTIRIKLPAMVRNTVREYFSHREGDGPSTNARSAAMEKELVINRLQWQRRDPHCSLPEGCPASAYSDKEDPYI
ncbi:uncharacterized protein arhgap20b isoform X1 [Alosa sapidissima]|uniref:uncharacterized protein arhgap20b isoform X1 n=2 Tax=Alosa sapidissima TaxID=34773 RepID=UPI001C09D941|nr:uncharacterized protein arhgap20b isoform X1 [Alosa sapidissima]